MVEGLDSLNQALKIGEDRGAILTSLRAICRIGYYMPNSIPLPKLEPRVLQQLQNWLLVDDDELVQACLEFFYQYTAVPANVLAFLEEQAKEAHRPALLEQLARFVLHNSKEDIKIRIVEPAIPRIRAESLVEMPEGLLKDLLKLKETDRSSMWLRCMFEEDAHSNVTQLELWQAYQNTFTPHAAAAGAGALLAAADFIRNVSSTFKSAEARIDPPNEHRPQPKFIIKGIKYRHTPINMDKVPYSRCLWTDGATNDSTGAASNAGASKCGSYHQEGQEMFNHILQKHLGVERPSGAELNSNGLKSTSKDCHWARCRHFSRTRGSDGPEPSAQEIMKHLLTHMPDATGAAAYHKKHNRTIAPNDYRAVYKHDNDVSGRNPNGYPGVHGSHAFEDTAVDEQNHAAGIAYWAVMNLRNLARIVPKALAAASEDSIVARPNKNSKTKLTVKDWMDRLFMEIEYHLWHVLAYNRVLRPHIYELLTFMEKARVVPKE